MAPRPPHRSRFPPTKSHQIPRRPHRSLLLRTFLPLLPCLAFSLRSIDALLFEPSLNQLLSPHSLLLLLLLGSCALCALARRSTSTALGLALVALAALKQFADTAVPTPHVYGGKQISCAVSGASAGIGRAVVAELARQGHEVFMGCRNRHRCELAREELLAKLPSVRPEQLVVLRTHQGAHQPLDLSRLSTVEAWAEAVVTELRARGGAEAKLGLLVLNAGYAPPDRPFYDGDKVVNPAINEESGWESGLYTMYVGHATLASRLATLGVLGSSSRAVAVASDALRFGGFHDSILQGPDGIGDLSGEHTRGCAIPGPLPALPVCIPSIVDGQQPAVFSPIVPPGLNFGSYPRAKLATLLLARELQQRHLVGFASAVMPGIVNTNIQRMDRSHNASALPTLLRLELYSPILDLPRAMLHTIPAALANGPPLPKSLPASRFEAAEAALNLATSVLNVALATASETLSACSPLISALEPYALTVAETYVLPLFQRTPEVAARVVLAAAVGSPHPTGEASRFGYHYFNGRGLVLGDESFRLNNVDLLNRVSERLWELAGRQANARRADEALAKAE